MVDQKSLKLQMRINRASASALIHEILENSIPYDAIPNQANL